MGLIRFYKYHGTGNDFVIVDNRDGSFNIEGSEYIRFLCHRRYGIGSDGFMLLETSKDHAFFMRYYNSDGNESTMCGNGGRCIAAFAQKLEIVKKNEMFEFEAVDGIHHAVCRNNGDVSLLMVDVNGISEVADGYFLNTGSPHFVCFTDDIESIDAVTIGRSIRNNSFFGKAGTNVNFVKVNSEQRGEITVRTYERGVEDETWSCGTGCVASVLTDHFLNGGENAYRILVKGGELNVRFQHESTGRYRDIWLEGPAKFVFEGIVDTP
jgi:diaminopimelate epimerase